MELYFSSFDLYFTTSARCDKFIIVMHVRIFLVHVGESVVRNVGELDQAGETISFQLRLVL